MQLITLHDILTAWRDDQITVEDALAMSQIDTEAELREAAMLSGVLPMRALTPNEREYQDLVDRILASVDKRLDAGQAA